jgi:hypothetical protein
MCRSLQPQKSSRSRCPSSHGIIGPFGVFFYRGVAAIACSPDRDMISAVKMYTWYIFQFPSFLFFVFGFHCFYSCIDLVATAERVNCV